MTRALFLAAFMALLVGGAAPGAGAAESDAGVAPAVAVFENLWFRTAARRIGLAYEAKGKLTVGADQVTFQHDGGALRIPNASIQRVERGRLAPDALNSWVIVRYEAGGVDQVAAFKPPLFGGSDGELYAALRRTAQEEALMGGFDPAEWMVGNQAGGSDQRITEFVRPGEKIDSWTELLTAQLLRRSAYPSTVDEMVSSSHQALVKRCPEVTLNVIARQAQGEPEGPGLLYEWIVKGCAGEADQHEVVRVMYGRFTIYRLAYVAKTAALAPEKREKWIADLKTAKIVVQK